VKDMPNQPDYASKAHRKRVLPSAPDEQHAFKRLFEIIRILRGPDGCPWDLKQTVETMRGYLIEESYEVIDAIQENSSEHLKEELGDVTLLILMMSYIEQQNGHFTVTEMLNEISDKLIRRHPHIFGDTSDAVLDEKQVKKTWDEIKKTEKKSKPSPFRYKTPPEHAGAYETPKSDQPSTRESLSLKKIPETSALRGVPRNAPPSDILYQLQKAASKVGFDWDDPLQTLDKVQEELLELRNEIEAFKKQNSGGNTEIERHRSDKLEEELGDLLFSVVNVSRKLGLHPDLAMRASAKKFAHRFVAMEQKLFDESLLPSTSNRDRMEQHWDSIKKQKP
jgi:tetrapyrrole methylase family protein / MazG family protein